MDTTTATSILAKVIPMLEALINDIPTAVSVIDIILPVLKEGRNLTTAEWDSLDALADKAHAALQGTSTDSSSS